MTDYGPLAQYVSAAGCLIAAATAVSLNWTHGAKWDPVEEDVARGPRRVAGLLNAVCIAVVWYSLREQDRMKTAAYLALGLAAGCLLALLIYGILRATLTYYREVAVAPNKVERFLVVGGFSLTPQARITMEKNQVTVQELFKGAAYDPDRIWPKFSRAIAKASLVLFYVLLVLTGTVALASASMLLGDKVDEVLSDVPADVNLTSDFANLPSVDDVLAEPAYAPSKVTFCYRNDSSTDVDLLIYNCFAWYVRLGLIESQDYLSFPSIIAVAAGQSGCKSGFSNGENWICVYVRSQDAEGGCPTPLLCLDICAQPVVTLTINSGSAPGAFDYTLDNNSDVEVP